MSEDKTKNQETKVTKINDLDVMNYRSYNFQIVSEVYYEKNGTPQRITIERHTVQNKKTLEKSDRIKVQEWWQKYSGEWVRCPRRRVTDTGKIFDKLSHKIELDVFIQLAEKIDFDVLRAPDKD